MSIRIPFTAPLLILAVLVSVGCGTNENTDTAAKQGMGNGRSSGNSQPPQRALSTTATVGTDRFSIALRQVDEKNRELVVVDGLNESERARLRQKDLSDDQWHSLFRIAVASESTSQLPSMLGDYRVQDGLLLFVPRFPWRPGLKYRAIFDPTHLPPRSGSTENRVSFDFELTAATSNAQTSVWAVYPSRDVLPENQLKFYLHFSAPMSQGKAYEHIHLLNSSGGEIELPFLELGEELWDNSGTRFTLLIDPGRIKRGLKPREEVGPALEQGKSYTLLIEDHWRDATGVQLKEAYRKAFTVIAPDDVQPNPERWNIEVPLAATDKPLKISFPESLDHAMLQRVLQIVDAVGDRVEGRVEVDTDETRWRFRPDGAWTAGSYAVVVESTLEDLAGNSIAKPFEVDVLRPITRELTAESVSIPFEIRAAESSRR